MLHNTSHLLKAVPVCRSSTQVRSLFGSKPKGEWNGRVDGLALDYSKGNLPASTWKGITGPRKAQVTTLSNGLRVASITSDINTAASLGLMVNVGSRHENKETSGSTHFLKHLAFSSSKDKFGLEVIHEFEDSGSTLTTTSGRENLLFASDVLHDNIPRILSVLGGILQPRLPYHEVARTQPLVSAEGARASECNVTILFDLLHREAYRCRGLGQSPIAPAHRIQEIDHQAMKKFVESAYNGGNAVVIGVGVEHDNFVKQVDAAFGQIASGKATEKGSASKYTGGEALVDAGGNTHVAIAFEGLSQSADKKDAAALGVLQYILGSATEGPVIGQKTGGLTSRLNKNVLSKSTAFKSAAAFNFSYSDSGLFGVYGEAAENPADLVNLLAGEISKLASEVSAEDLARGKAGYKAHLFETSEKRVSVVRFVGEQVLSSGKVATPEELAAQVDGVTAADVARVSKKVFASKPTLVAIGDVSNIPELTDYKPRLNIKAN